MAHNIGEMFYFGEIPWHEQGTKISKPATIEEALKAGGLNWEVKLAPLALADEPDSAAPQRMAVVRTDRAAGHAGRVIGVVHPEFRLLQNRDAGMLFDRLFGKGKPVYHTGGYLKHGEVIWLLAKLPEGFRVSPKDEIQTYLLLSNSHDGSLPIDIRLTTVRVVCNNTLSLALSSHQAGHVFRHAHNGRLERVEAAAASFFQAVMDAQHAMSECTAWLDKVKCEDERFKRFVERLLPLPALPASAATVPAVRRAHETRTAKVQLHRNQILAIHAQGFKLDDGSELVIEPAAKSWWGALNSVTAWVDHASEITGHRYAHSLFGRGDKLKSVAYMRAQDEAKI
jgi:phage/plasmid-like protein (TIGR03299 family)